MKYLFFIVLLVAVVITAGCVGGDKETVVEPVQTTALSVSTPPTVQPPFTADTHKKIIVTSSPLKTIKDSELWFTMQVPESWEVKTGRISNPEGYEGLVYMTYLHDNPVPFNTHEFYIITYAISRSQDQSFRNYYRDKWTPLPNESTIIINGITFDRFESKTDNDVQVAYVVRKISANERGFASVIEYSLDSSSQYQRKDFESFISTFQYEGAKEIKSAAGEEIKR